MPLPAANLTIRQVEVGDVTLEIAETGVGGRPLLMLHGLTGAKEDFGDWWDQLAERGWHVVAPDLRGHGASDHPPRTQDYTLELFEADVLALVDDLGWDRFVLLGHSMGGMISQAIAVDHPDRLDGLVLMDTVADASSLEGGGAQMLVLKVVMRLFGMKALARFLRKPPPRLARVGGAPLRRAARLRRVDPGQGPRHLAHDGPGHDGGPGPPCRPRARARAPLDLPVLVIVGEHDMPGFVEGSRRMADAIPGATFVLLAGAAHSPQLETPEAWWTTLTGFLDGLANR